VYVSSSYSCLCSLRFLFACVLCDWCTVCLGFCIFCVCFLVLGYVFSVLAERLAGKIVFKMTYLVLSGTLNLNPVSLSIPVRELA